MMAPVVESALGNILTDWKTKYNFVGSHYLNIGNDPRNGESTDWDSDEAYLPTMVKFRQ